ncbi:MAG: hypothetical protein IJW78_05345 [Clostridia bacterium]|nr:hypothetical protein [Clostridia bacterium]
MEMAPMKKKKVRFTPWIDFNELTPEICIGAEKRHPLYERAFLFGEDKSETELAQNTTTWD